MPPVQPSPTQPPYHMPQYLLQAPPPSSTPQQPQTQGDQFLTQLEQAERRSFNVTPSPSTAPGASPTQSPTQSLEDVERRVFGNGSGNGSQNNPNGQGGRSFFGLPNIVQLVSAPLALCALSTNTTGVIASIGNWIRGSTVGGVVTPPSTIGRWLSFGGGTAGATGTRVSGGMIAPWLSLGIALFDNGADWYNYFTTNPTLSQTPEERTRTSQARSRALSNAVTNTICTGIGAGLGAAIFGFFSFGVGTGVGAGVGAMIGAGFGNIVGNLLKGTGGFGRAIINFFTGR